MILHNKKILAEKVRYYDTYLRKIKGLRFSSKLKDNEALILENKKKGKIRLDMIFVFSPIDAIWLDEHKKVVEIRRNIKPFTPLVTPKKLANYVIEIKAGASSRIQVSDYLLF